MKAREILWKHDGKNVSLVLPNNDIEMLTRFHCTLKFLVWHSSGKIFLFVVVLTPFPSVVPALLVVPVRPVNNLMGKNRYNW